MIKETEIESSSHIILNGYALSTSGDVIIREESSRFFTVCLYAKVRDDQDLHFLINAHNNQNDLIGMPFSLITEEGAACCSTCIINSMQYSSSDGIVTLKLGHPHGISLGGGLHWM